MLNNNAKNRKNDNGNQNTKKKKERKLLSFKPGLEGVVLTRSTISYVDGKQGLLEYRGINISDLVQNSTFEETVYLLLRNHLPTHREFNQFNTLFAKQRHLPHSVRDAIQNFPVGMHPIIALQSGITMLAGEDFYSDDVSSPIHNLRRCISLIAKVPAMVAAFNRHRNGEEPLPCISKYTHAENFLFMLSGEPPDPKLARIFDKLLIMHAEHTMNASTFVSRIIGSTNGSLYSAVSGAVGALSGNLHGGANERVLRMLYSIGHPDNVESFVEEMLSTKTKIMGIGHRIYKVKDPRASITSSFLETFLEHEGGEEFRNLYNTALRLEEVVKEKLGSKNIYPNVDFYSGIVFENLKIPKDLFTTVFAIARVVGWAAHWVEQVSANRLYRPLLQYIGDHDRPYVDIDKR